MKTESEQWKEGEYAYCLHVVRSHGIGLGNPVTVASYLRLQAADALRDGEHAIAQHLSDAAAHIECQNPDWNCAIEILENLNDRGAETKGALK